MRDDKIDVTCCFCEQSLPFDKAIEISIKVDKKTDELQMIYSHSKCVDKALHQSVPRGFEIE